MLDPKTTGRRTRRFLLNHRTEERLVRRDKTVGMRGCCEDRKQAGMTRGCRFRIGDRNLVEMIEEALTAGPVRTIRITNPVFCTYSEPDSWSPERDTDFDVPCQVTPRRLNQPTSKSRKRDRRGPSMAGLMTQRSAVNIT